MAADSTTSLRRFPHPYRGALALCNDADYLTHSRFRRLHAFLATGEETEWGPGLDLAVGGSFFMFCSPDSPNELTVFDRLSSTITDDGERLLERVKSGELDVLHTYGCFTRPEDFSRRLAELALATLESRGIKVRTWVNHGPPSNIQCILRLGSSQGDLPGSPAYHTDLIVEHGLRWIWAGHEMTDRIALDADHGGAGKRMGDWISQKLGKPDHADTVTRACTLRDGRELRGFYRYTGLHGRTPVLEDLPAQLSEANLDHLAASGGYAVVYQHLAVRRLRPGFGPAAYGPVEEEWFKPDELAALRRLSERHHRGEIWVTPTTRLLEYRDIWHALRWHSTRHGEADRIVIDLDAQSIADATSLAGITFYCERPQATEVYARAGGTEQRIGPLRVNPVDATGRASITIAAGEGRPGEPPLSETAP